ncbi:MAG TPA: hypothetical protein VIJ68_04405 [Candidatus Saccharimonadales bacterium]
MTRSGSFENDSPAWQPSNEEILYTASPDEAFRLLAAQDWIDQFRVETGGKFDMEATVAALGIPLVKEMPIIDGKQVLGAGAIRGIGSERGKVPVAIHLDPEWSADEHNLTTGHELGHLFLETSAGIPSNPGGREIERFCELFGRQMVVPVQELAEVDTVSAEAVTELMARFGTRHTTMIYQLMLAGKLPHRIYVDVGIGGVPNEFRSGKVSRHCLCLDCEMGNRHQPEDEFIPVYDFTSFEWHNTTPFAACVTDWGDLNLFAVLNRAYGRWGPEDDAAVLEEAAAAAKIRQVLARARDQESASDDSAL